MSRPAKFFADAILDACRDAVVVHGRDVTIAEIGSWLGAPTGSIYHRFGSRDELLTRLWLRSIGRWHDRLFEVMDAHEADPRGALVAMSVEVARYCREFPAEALAMTLFRQARLAEQAPEELRDKVVRVNDQVRSRLLEVVCRQFPQAGHDPEFAQIAELAVIQLPYGLVRPFVGGVVPGWLDDLIRAAVEGALTLGDR